MKKLLKIPVLFFALMLIVSSCGNETKSDDTSKNETKSDDTSKNDKELCSFVESQFRLLNDAKEAIRLFNDDPINGQEEMLRIKKEFERIETESDKFFETRDGRTEADVESNFELMQSCPSFNALSEFMDNGGEDIFDFIANFDDKSDKKEQMKPTIESDAKKMCLMVKEMTDLGAAFKKETDETAMQKLKDKGEQLNKEMEALQNEMTDKYKDELEKLEQLIKDCDL